MKRSFTLTLLVTAILAGPAALAGDENSPATEGLHSATPSCPQIGVPGVQYADGKHEPLPVRVFDKDFNEIPRPDLAHEPALPASPAAGAPAECVHSGYSDAEGDVWEYKIALRD